MSPALRSNHFSRDFFFFFWCPCPNNSPETAKKVNRPSVSFGGLACALRGRGAAGADARFPGLRMLSRPGWSGLLLPRLTRAVRGDRFTYWQFPLRMLVGIRIGTTAGICGANPACGPIFSCGLMSRCKSSRAADIPLATRGDGDRGPRNLKKVGESG